MSLKDEFGLNPKQRLFADQYLIDMDAKAAYTRVYGAKPSVSEANGTKLSNKPNVKKYIQAKLAKVQDKLEITQEYVLKSIYETMERCKQAMPVYDKKGKPLQIEVIDDEGNITLSNAYVFDAKNVLKGSELLGKHLKLFTEKIEHIGNVTIIASDNDERI